MHCLKRKTGAHEGLIYLRKTICFALTPVFFNTYMYIHLYIRLMFLYSNLNTEHDTGVQQREIIATPNFQQSLKFQIHSTRIK